VGLLRLSEGKVYNTLRRYARVILRASVLLRGGAAHGIVESMNATELFKAAVRQERLAQGLSQERLAERMGRKRQWVQAVESTSAAGLHLATVDAFSKALGKAVWEMFTPACPECHAIGTHEHHCHLAPES
jgi:L-alanine-DL-glutamate epimerase-like enolase superfamily enzyme